MEEFNFEAHDYIYEAVKPFGSNILFYRYMKNKLTNRVFIIKSIVELATLKQDYSKSFWLDLSYKLEYKEKGSSPMSFSDKDSDYKDLTISAFLSADILANNGFGKITSLIDFQPKERIRFEAIDLSRNNLKELPDWIAKSADCIIAQMNLIETFPDAIRGNNGLEVLDLSFNKITYVDRFTFFRANTRLKVLNLSHNKIQSLDFEVFNLLHLEELDLSFNNFDDEIYTMSPLYLRGNTKLKKLDLSFCGFQVVLLDLRKHKNLEILRLEGLRIRDYDEQLGLFHGLDKLEELSLACNEIYELIPEIESCTSLIELDLSGNDLTTIPEEVFNLPKLEKLILTDNPISEEMKTYIKIRFADKNDGCFDLRI